MNLEEVRPISSHPTDGDDGGLVTAKASVAGLPTRPYREDTILLLG